MSFDIENRPLNYIASDYTGSEVTVIACAFLDEPRRIAVWALGEVSMRAMLRGFRKWYDASDMVIGHYIRGHDLPIVNAAFLEEGLPGLGDKLTHDTKIDLVKMGGLSKSQKNLAAMLGVAAGKVDMDQSMWRSANRLRADGIRWAKVRAKGDVKQNMEMYWELCRLGMLRRPQMWRAASGGVHTRYVP